MYTLSLRSDCDDYRPGRAYAGRNAAHEILSLAAEKKYRPDRHGNAGRAGVKDLFLGTVAEHVVRESSVPVLTIHPNAPD